MRPFTPLFGNPHLLTIAGNFWPRKIDEEAFPAKRRLYKVDGQNTVVVLEHQPQAKRKGQVVFLHGLEGSANAGYILSFAQEALKRGFAVHRKNLRTCGATENLCQTMYHSGLTGDTELIVRSIRAETKDPIFLVGFSLGGNVALKLAGELGDTDLLSGVCAVSTPIDLAACVRSLGKPSNLIYSRRFLRRLCERIERKNKLTPGSYDTTELKSIRSIWEFDDKFTAPLFGFGTADNYYRTQSAQNYLDSIQIPSLVITGKDDPLVPFEIYKTSAFERNPALTLLAVDQGGHLGFLSRNRPRFWLDQVGMDWIEQVRDSILPRQRPMVNTVR